MISFSDFLSLSRFPPSYNQGWFSDSLSEVSEYDLQALTGYDLWVALGTVSGLLVSGYDIADTYIIGDTVSYQGLFYRSLVNANTGNIPSMSSAYWAIADLYTTYYNYVRPFCGKAVAAKLVATQGIQVTPFALSIAGATSGDAADSSERSKLTIEYANSRDRYARGLTATLLNKRFTLDGIYYRHDRNANPSRTMIFTV
jgi:hypothetical protein